MASKITNAAAAPAESEPSYERRDESGIGMTGLASRLVGVKPFPHIVARIHALATDPSKTVADVAAIVEKDVAFTTRMLRVVNNPTMGLRQRCVTVQHALALLGMDRVASLATATAAFAFLVESSPSAPSVAAHAVATGNVARALAKYAQVSPDEAFTAGLLHDVGMLLILQLKDPLYEELIEQVGPGNEPTLDEERALLGFDHAAFGALVLHRWQLPAPLPDMVALHHDWPTAKERGGTVAKLAAVLRVADVLAPRLEAHAEPSEEDIEALRSEPALEGLGVGADELVASWATLRAAATSSDEAEPAPLSADDLSDGTARKRGGASAPNASLRPMADMLEPSLRPPRPAKASKDSRMAIYVGVGVVVVGALAAIVDAIR